MYNRRKYKDFALKQLKGRWGVPVVMSIITGLIMLIFNAPEYIKMMKTEAFHTLWNADFMTFGEMFTAINEMTDSASSTLTSIIQIVVDGILSLAAINVYLKMSRSPEPVSFSNFIDGLNNWWRGTLAALWQFLWVTLWSMLFFIPGIIKAIAYSQTMFIVGEYEDISITKAMRISITITQGHKGDLFMTYLSFLGWAILAAIPAGIGFIFLEPYYKMTMTNAYHALLKEALETGKIRPEDLA